MDKDLKYKTIETPSEGLYKEKGSKFLAFAHSVTTEEEVKLVLGNYRSKFHDARHHCFAFRVGITDILERSNDDGEPSGTAGKPILGQIHSFNLTNVMVVVIRYFGGTKLGVSGLINAYKIATRDALSQAIIVEKEVRNIFKIECHYNEMGSVMSFLKQQKINYKEVEMAETVSMKIFLKFSQTEAVIDKLKQIFKTIQIKKR
ncbi:MAG: YigZ family protein [Bacteroidales bacterium]|nr:YigZ family protein [Bacteroidales bacterium]